MIIKPRKVIALIETALALGIVLQQQEPDVAFVCMKRKKMLSRILFRMVFEDRRPISNITLGEIMRELAHTIPVSVHPSVQDEVH